MRGPSLLVALLAAVATSASAQTPRQLSILNAEQRRAHTSRDLAVIRGGAGSSDLDTALLAVRALGRLERPALIADLLIALRSRFPEVRAEAAGAIGQAAQGWGSDAPEASLDRATTALITRLELETDADVRASICETLGRLPYTNAAQAGRAERALVEAAGAGPTVTDRLGVAKGLEALVRLHGGRKTPDAETLALLATLAVPPAEEATAPRVRRLAMAALISATAVDDGLVARAGVDPDDQVRRLAMRGATLAGAVSPGGAAGVFTKGLADPAAVVRFEALRGTAARRQGEPGVCELEVHAAGDPDMHVALLALDELQACAASAAAVSLLDITAGELADTHAGSWHRAVHALVALAAAQPDRARVRLPRFADSDVWQVRVYAARAAGRLHDAAALERLAVDPDDNVREAAIEQLHLLEEHDADELYIASLSRSGYQAVRAAAHALVGSPSPALAVPALQGALERLSREGHDNSTSARVAIRSALVSLGIDAGAEASAASRPPALTLDSWRRLASARARITVRGKGTLELALLADLAPQTVMRFAELAEAGYYDGLTFHRVVPNFVVQGGSPGASEYVGDPWYMNDELGRWPHTRGAVGLSTRGRDTGDAQFFINVVDNPGLDHEYTVFAHVFDGLDVVDGIVEGDVIEHIEILVP